MKSCILKGLCVFFMLLSLFTSAFTLVAEAQSGHGGSTEVIARIEPPTDAPTEAAPTASKETQPSQNLPASSDGQPIRTGEAMAWSAIIALIISGSVVILFRLKNKNQT